MYRHLRPLRYLLFLLCCAFASAAADPLLYRLDDGQGTVWLLGSVHALRADDYPLDPRIEDAYRHSERVVLEVDPAEMDPVTISGIALELARFDDGETLSSVFPESEYKRLKQGLAALGIEIRQLEPFKPWFAGLQLLSLNLARHGFAMDSGVDRHFAGRAAGDNKKTAGLETVREQLQLFDRLPMEAQKTFLLEALEDSDDFGRQMADIVSAWRRGDIATLEKLADEELGKDPALREMLLSARNRAWAKEIADYLQDPETTLVIVGALHLVGDDGVVTLLEEAGHEVTRVRGDGEK